MEIQSESIKKLVATYDRYIENCKKSIDLNQVAINKLKQEFGGCPDKYSKNPTYNLLTRRIHADEVLQSAHENTRANLIELDLDQSGVQKLALQTAQDTLTKLNVNGVCDNTLQIVTNALKV